MWTGSCIDSENRIALLSVVVLRGYHSLTKYQWKQNGVCLKNEVYPIIYAESRGSYTCEIVVSGESIATFSFTISGLLQLWRVAFLL